MTEVAKLVTLRSILKYPPGSSLQSTFSEASLLFFVSREQSGLYPLPTRRPILDYTALAYFLSRAYHTGFFFYVHLSRSCF